MQMLGCVYDPVQVKRIYDRLETLKRSKRDFVLPIKKLFWTTVAGSRPSVQMMGNQAGKVFRVGAIDDACPEWFMDWSEAEEAANRSGKPIQVVNGDDTLPMTRNAIGQLLERLRVPAKFATYLIESGNADILDDTTNQLIARNGSKCMVRCIEGRVRAVVSDRYRIMDNEDVFLAAADVLESVDAQVWKARLTDDRFELFAVSGHISGQVRLDRPIDGYRWKGDEGDTHNAAAWITNSETGNGGRDVRPAVMRKVCQNFNAWGDVIRSIHIGRQLDEGIVYADETIAAESKTFFFKLRDAITTVFDAEAFAAYIARLNRITQQILPDAIVAVDRTIARFQLGEDRKGAILANLFGSQDLTRYGLVQSLTEAAHKYDESDPDVAVSLEQAGGQLIEMLDADYESLVRV